MNTQYRNWFVENWNKYVSEFCDQYSIASIGHKKHSLHINGTDDLRNIGLEELSNTLSLASCCVGSSSGPMHLASLCCTPHIVWTDKRHHKIINGTNRLRYTELWNPFKTKCQIVDTYGWQPPVCAIINATKNLMSNKQNEIVEKYGSPVIAIPTYNRPEYFETTIDSLERSGLDSPKVFISDDNSDNIKKQSLLRKCSGKYNIINNPENYGVFTNSKSIIDLSFQLTNSKWIVYSQDDIEYKFGWYKELEHVVNKLYTSGIDWGILALVYYHCPKKWSHKDFHIMPTGHPGGACWAINRDMWYLYRKDKKIFDFSGDRKRRERLFDFKISHWCHHNSVREFAVCHVKNSLVQHIGANSTLTDRDMSKWTGLNYNG